MYSRYTLLFHRLNYYMISFFFCFKKVKLCRNLPECIAKYFRIVSNKSIQKVKEYSWLHTFFLQAQTKFPQCVPCMGHCTAGTTHIYWDRGATLKVGGAD